MEAEWLLMPPLVPDANAIFPCCQGCQHLSSCAVQREDRALCLSAGGAATEFCL